MKMLTTVFWNRAEGRLRAGWRIALTFAVIVIVMLPVQLALKPLLPDSWGKDQKIDVLIAFVAIVATIVIPIARRRIDRRSLASLGLRRSRVIRDAAAGFFISAVLVLIVVGIEYAFGWIRFEVVPLDTQARLASGLHLLVFSGLVVAWWENLFNVAYMFENLRDGCGFWWAMVINCLVFALLHMGNPNATIWALAGIALIHSYEIFAYLRAGSLWLVLGIHAGWNFFQGIAGFPISGSARNPLVRQVNTTPAWFGGGSFGPEAGLVILLVAIAAYAMIHAYCSRLAPRRGGDIPL